MAEPGQARDPAVLEQPAPCSDGVVVKQENRTDFLAVHAAIQQYNRVGPARQTMRQGPITSHRK